MNGEDGHVGNYAPEPPRTIDRVRTERGELVLRQTSHHFEIISNGVFLMDTSDGTSERLLIDAAISRVCTPSPRLLIGGLGVGFSLIRATAHPTLAAIDVVEIEKTVIGWHEQHLRHLTGEALADPRVRLTESDILDWLERATDPYDAICLDTDNGPNWLVFDTNKHVYAQRGLSLTYDRLAPGGVLAVWSASRDTAYEGRLRVWFDDVEVLETAHPSGTADVVYVARRPAQTGGAAGDVTPL